MGLCLSKEPQNCQFDRSPPTYGNELAVEQAEQIQLREEGKVSLADFDFIRVIGRGGYGKVMLVSQKATGKLYAMKIMRKDLISQLKSRLYTENERKVLAMADCPFIVKLHYAFQTANKLYLIIDFMIGGELFFHLRRAGCFPESWAKFYCAEIVIALEYLHSRDIIYRDLKAENVLLERDGHIKITDFGLCKTDVTEKELTTTICGTYDYMAPEIYLQRGHNQASDWYSLGILLYVMISGLPPFYSQNKRQMLRNRLEKPVEFKEGVFSLEAQNLLTQLLAINPKHRLGSNGADEVRNHKFFSEIDWEMLQRKQIEPPFVPKLFGEKDLRNFDKAFTSEVVKDTPIEEAIDDHYDKFSYHKSLEKKSTSHSSDLFMTMNRNFSLAK